MNDGQKSREVITVQGIIRPEEMGVTYPHEHLFLDAMDHYSSYGYQLVIDDEDMMAQEILDNIGYLDYQPAYVRADNVAALVGEGFVERVLLSEDICMLNHLKYTGGKGYGYLLETFVPLLNERGVTDQQIHQMMVVNPAKAFSRRRDNVV